MAVDMARGARPVFHQETGHWLMKLREGRGLSLRQVEILSKGRVKKGTLTSIESGRVKHPDDSLLREIARIYEWDYREIALRFITGNYGRDLARHFGDQQSGLPLNDGALTDDTAAARMEIERLRTLVDKYQKEAREVRSVADSLARVALNLEEIRKAPARKADRRGRDRKVG